MPEDVEALRHLVHGALPEHIRAALAAYRRFTADEPPTDAKGFAAWHGAAKAALAHVEALVKLVRWAEGETAPAGAEDHGIETLLNQARQALDRLDDDDI